MKKAIVLLIFVAALFLFVSCAGPFGSSDRNNDSGNNSSTADLNSNEEKSDVFRVEGSSIYAKNTSISGEIVIPETFNGQTITTIPAKAFKDCTGITSVIIPETVQTIGAGAFSGCIRLNSITLPFVGGSTNGKDEKSLFGYIFGEDTYTGGTTIRQYYNSNWWENNCIPSGLRTVKITKANVISYGAFQNCSMLTEIDLNEDILAVGSFAFQNCSSIKTIQLPSVFEIKNSVFSGCTSLEEFTIGDSVTTIESSVFNGCANLKRINSETDGEFIIPETVTSIGASAFNGCLRLNSITLPFVGGSANGKDEKSLFGYIFGEGTYTGGTTIRQYYNSNWWENNCIPSGLRTVKITKANVISYGAFQNCSMLTKLQINASAESNVGTKAFDNCISPEWIR